MSHKEIEECLICARIPLGEILINCYDLYTDENIAKKVGHQAAEIIYDVFQKDPIFLCGKSPKTIQAAVIYIASHLIGKPLLQYDIAKVLMCTEASLRKHYQRITKFLNLKIKSLLDYNLRVRCNNCLYKPPLEQFETEEQPWGGIDQWFVCKKSEYKINSRSINSPRKCGFYQESAVSN